MMKTKTISIHKDSILSEVLREAAEALSKGDLVAFPTETVYGLGANALDEIAVQKIFEAKGRPSDNPLIVHISDKKELSSLVKNIPIIAEKLIEHFWPGPLTLIFEKSEIIPDIISGGLATVAVRMPNNPVALALIAQAGVPIAAPSANLSGKPSPTSAAHVLYDLGGKIDMIVDAGETSIGLESTVLNLTSTPPELLRPGGICIEELEAIVGKIVIPPMHTGKKSEQIAAKSPGMKYRHYAPKAKVIIVEGNQIKVETKIEELIIDYKSKNKEIAVMTRNKEHNYSADMTKVIGNNYANIAKNLFAYFREFDQTSIDVIIVEGLEEKGLGLAIMNRLRKAAYQTVKV